VLFRITAAAALIATSVQSAQAARQPTGQWVVNFDAAQCFAARNYGTIEKPLYLVIKAPPMGEVVQLGILREGPAVRAEQQKGSIQFDELEPIRISMLDYKQPKSRLRTFLANVPAEKFSAARRANSVRVSTPGVDERFALTSMASLLKTIDDCVADLRRVWNVSNPGERHPSLKEAAKGNLQGLFDSDDYPTQALFEEGTGSVRVVMLVSEQGRIADCSVVETSGFSVLDAQTCAVILERARFTPAVGLTGKPAKSVLYQKITWRLR
jgi:TonB family protein